MERRNKKGQMGIGVLVGVAVTFVVVIVVLAFGQNILSDIKGDFVTNSLEYNATGDGQLALSNISEKTPLLGTIIVASIIIGILVTAFVIRSE